MSGDGYGPMEPGSASAGEEEPEIPVDPSRIGIAHYHGMTEEAASQTFAKECICTTCFQSTMCKIGGFVSESGTVVTRCLGYTPVSG
jgi:hypothetical protein